jgi:hypothetical protein
MIETLFKELKLLSTTHKKPKVVQKDPIHIPLVESLHVSVMVVAYNIHFQQYNEGRKHVT